MKLLTKSIENKFSKYPIYSQDGKGENATIICKFFFGPMTWYVLEASKDGDDWTMFGYVCNDGLGVCELGYFSLRELESLKYWGVPCVERDRYFDACKVRDCEELNERRERFTC